MEIQKRIVFAVELEFTLTSPLFCTPRELPHEEAAGEFYHAVFAPLPPLCPNRTRRKVAPFVRPMVQLKACNDPYIVRCCEEGKVIACRTPKRETQAQTPQHFPAAESGLLSDQDGFTGLFVGRESCGNRETTRPNHRPVTR